MAQETLRQIRALEPSSRMTSTRARFQQQYTVWDIYLETASSTTLNRANAAKKGIAVKVNVAVQYIDVLL